MRTLEDKIKALPEGRRRKIEARTKELLREEITLREFRKARTSHRRNLRKASRQAEQISRIEKRTDLHISTLRRTVEAMGGELTIFATFPKGAPVKLVGLGISNGRHGFSHAKKSRREAESSTRRCAMLRSPQAEIRAGEGPLL